MYYIYQLPVHKNNGAREKKTAKPFDICYCYCHIFLLYVDALIHSNELQIISKWFFGILSMQCILVS